jgi:hypothetical protein
VLDAECVTIDADSIEAAVERLAWARPDPTHEDGPWLSAWLHTPRRSGVFLRLLPAESSVSLSRRIGRSLSA